jgi:quercetin dioxygenase-like cupin family protein
MSQPYLALAGDHQQLDWLGGSVVEVLLDAPATDGQLTVMRSTLERGDAAPLHVHSAEDELFVVLEGEVTFWVADDRQEVGAGGLAWLPRGLPHTYRVDSETAAFLTLCTPGGFEGFFRTAGHDRATPRPADWAITPQSMAAALVGMGGQLLGPPKGADD